MRQLTGGEVIGSDTFQNRSSPVKIGIVDDDEDYFVLIRALLKQIEPSIRSYWIAEFDAAVADIHRQEADCYIIDYRLGEKTGLDVLDAVRKDVPLLPLILLTGIGDRDVDIAAMEKGASDFLSKANLTPETLERAIRYSLRRAEDAQKLRAAAQTQIEKETAEAANRAKSEFLAHMSHEIRSPLTAILGFAKLAQEPDLSAKERREFLKIILRSGEHLLNVVNDVLDLSKIESGHLTVDRSPFDYKKLMEETVALFNPTCSKKCVGLTLNFRGRIPKAVIGDSHRFKQILINLLSNAIKFTDSGTVEVDVEESESKLCVSVKDSGIGISPEEQTRLFQPFSQANALTSKRFGGTGLGLDLSKRLAHAMGGDLILVESAPGRGSTFEVTLPIEKGIAIEPSNTTCEAKPVLPSHLKVLLVEDSKDNQLLVRQFLKGSPVELETASNGRQGLEAALEHEIDAVLMDIQMPEMDGYEATRRLRAAGFKKPIIALTAHALDEERKKILESGFSGFVSKPISKDELLQTLAANAASTGP